MATLPTYVAPDRVLADALVRELDVSCEYGCCSGTGPVEASYIADGLVDALDRAGYRIEAKP